MLFDIGDGAVSIVEMVDIVLVSMVELWLLLEMANLVVKMAD